MSSSDSSPSPLGPVHVAVYNFAGGLQQCDAFPDPNALLEACEDVMRQLAPDLPKSTGAYLSAVQRCMAAESLHLLAAVHKEGDAAKVLGVSLVRVYENSFNGTKAHLEGMCTDASYRSRGIGREMMSAVKALAARLGATSVVLQVDSQCPAAHRFLMREGLTITDYAFTAPSTKVARGDGRELASPLAVQAGNSEAGAAASPSPTAPVGSEPAPFRVMELSESADRIIPAAHESILRASEPVFRQLRDDLFSPGTEWYVARMRRIVADGGRMAVAVATPAPDAPSDAAPVVLGVCMYRFYHDLARGGARRNFIDDLVTDSDRRSQGVGKALLHFVRQQASGMGVAAIELDSGLHRGRAHAFYFREGMHIDKLSFGGTLQQTKRCLQ